MIGAEMSAFLSVLKALGALIRELERSILGYETCEGSSNLGEVCDEPSIESSMAKEAMNYGYHASWSNIDYSRN